MSLSSFMKKRRTRDKLYTHLLVGAPFGTYALGADLEQFWSLYLTKVQNSKILYIAENPNKETPILVDVDLKIDRSLVINRLNNGMPIYTEEQLLLIVDAYQTVLKDIIKDLKPEALTCIVLEKPPKDIDVNGTIYVRNGLHLHFPKLFLARKEQDVYLIPIIREKIKTVFKNLGIDNPIDTNSTNVHWLMYGSRKPKCKPYKVTKCFLDNCKPVSLNDALNDYLLINTDTDNKISCNGCVEQMLPRILSTFLYNRLEYYYECKSNIDTPLIDKYREIKQKRKKYDQLSVDDALKEATKLLNMVSVERADERGTWLAIGFCLWNITQGDADGLDLWLTFSEQSPKFNEAECIASWNSMRENHYTIGTLVYFAKKDSPEDYEEYINNTGNHLIQEALKGCHNDLARILYNEYGTEFVCSSIINKTWYQYKNHIWKEDENGVELRKRISCPNGIILKKLTENIHNLTNQMGNDDVDENAIEKNIKKVGDIIRNCKSAPFKNYVMVECQEVFYDPRFEYLLNKNPNIIAFKNGVYDFTNDVFREGKPEDYLSVSLPIDYVVYSINDPDIKNIEDFFLKIFPDKEIRECFLEQVCQVFIGGNPDKIVLIWIGEGNNGKTITQTMFEKMLDKFAIKFNTTLITGKKANSSAANPELARAGNGVRWAVTEEANPEEMISAGILKNLTGNDSFLARDLFEKGKKSKETVPMFKFNIICNTLMPLKNPDSATWSRIRVIPFESTFVPQNECPESFQEQLRQKIFPMDKNFSSKIPAMLQPLAWYLINKWQNCNGMERYIPVKVRIATDKYRTGNDVYHQFEKQQVFTKPGAKLTFSALYCYFKEWYKEECPNQTIPNRSTVIAKFSARWGTVVKFWEDKTCVQDDDDDNEE